MSKVEKSDPLLDELDEVRHRTWDACGQDMDTYFAMLEERQQQLIRDGWPVAPRRNAQDQSAA